MKILCVFGEHNYGDPRRGLGYEYANFIPAFKNLGHDVSFFESQNKSCYIDYADMNRQLLKTVDRERPDTIFFTLSTYEIWLESLTLIREGSAATLIHWATDDSWKYEQFSRFMAPAFDLYITTYPSAVTKAEQDGIPHVVLSQWAADSSRMMPPLLAKECSYCVSFIGSAYGNRLQWVEKLRQRGIQVEAFGYDWPNGPVAALELTRIIRESQISLNFGDSGIILDKGRLKHSRQIKARVFEVPGAGGMLATEKAELLEDFYTSGKEIVVFDDINELVEKIEYLLAHPEVRDSIAQAGYSRTKREHSYEARFGPLLVQALEHRKTRELSGCGIDFGRFEEIAKSSRPNLLLMLLKGFLLAPCLILFGKKRGPRAARRILYEISWRFLGKKTYSASNWAGRIFYENG